ncbi:MAG: alpha/beta hydrolase [Taibaiella sp.]|nr:alpha/beta hydrolase [Taibaiella sp.]
MPSVSTTFCSALHYHKKGTGPAVVLLHGFPANSGLWSYVWDELASHYTLIVPDFPGVGSSPLEQSVSLEQIAEGIKQILDTENIDKTVIAGHSMGGYVAFAFADLHPGRVAGLSVVHSTPAADDDEKKQMRRKAIELIKNGGKAAFLKQAVYGLFTEDFRRAEPAKVEEQLTTAMSVQENALINFYQAMIERPDRSKLLINASYPVQWIMGAQDKVIPEQKVLPFTCHAPVNFVTIYPDGAHMSMIENPGQLQADLKEFIQYCYKA